MKATGRFFLVVLFDFQYSRTSIKRTALQNEVLSLTNDMFQPSKMYGKEPRDNEPSI